MPVWAYTPSMDGDSGRQTAQRILAARQAAGLSKGALAERLGVRLWAIDRIEAGRVEPSDDLLALIADATTCPVTWLRPADGDGSTRRPAQPEQAVVAAAPVEPARLRGVQNAGAEPVAQAEPESEAQLAELRTAAAERETVLARTRAERDVLKEKLAAANAAAAIARSAADAQAAAIEVQLTAARELDEALACREASLAAREQALADASADQAAVGRALIRREIRLEVHGIAL